MADHKLDAEPGHHQITGSPVEFNVVGKLVERLRGGQLEDTRLEATATVTGAARGSLTQTITLPTIPSQTKLHPPSIGRYPSVLLQAAVVNLGARTNEGALVESVSVAWLAIVQELANDPEFLFKVPPRKLEELVAGAYERDGWPDVVLTPRSGDRGRDVIATRPGWGSLRFIEQVKAYSPNHRVTADQVRSTLGVVLGDPRISKGVVTTSSGFAPRILQDPQLAAHVPYRLELKDGTGLLEWLTGIGARSRRS